MSSTELTNNKTSTLQSHIKISAVKLLRILSPNKKLNFVINRYTRTKLMTKKWSLEFCRVHPHVIQLILLETLPLTTPRPTSLVCLSQAATE